MNPTQDPGKTENLCNFLYCSHATAQMNDSELPRILEKSKTNNADQGITGLLVYGGGMFLQWLEGPRDKVEALMGRLEQDPRHETIVRLQVLDGLKERLYPTWAMRSVAPGDIHEILIDCLSRARSDSHAQLISLMVELLHTDQLAPLHR
jgi:Sensors of blue-light using FAD